MSVSVPRLLWEGEWAGWSSESGCWVCFARKVGRNARLCRRSVTNVCLLFCHSAHEICPHFTDLVEWESLESHVGGGMHVSQLQFDVPVSNQ